MISATFMISIMYFHPSVSTAAAYIHCEMKESLFFSKPPRKRCMISKQAPIYTVMTDNRVQPLAIKYYISTHAFINICTLKENCGINLSS